MNLIMMSVAVVLLLPALYFLLTRRRRGDGLVGSGREDYQTDSPLDRPPPPEENVNRARNT